MPATVWFNISIANKTLHLEAFWYVYMYVYYLILVGDKDQVANPRRRFLIDIF